MTEAYSNKTIGLSVWVNSLHSTGFAQIVCLCVVCLTVCELLCHVSCSLLILVSFVSFFQDVS